MSAITTTKLRPANTLQQTPIAAAMAHWPYTTWILLLLVVNLPLVWGAVREAMIFLPDAVAQGQWWRVVTYPLVHLSWYHLVLDGLGFLLLLGCLAENRLLVKCFYLAATSAGALLLTWGFDPAVSQQGLSGLSGIAHGLMAITALELRRDPDQRRWGTLSLGVVVLKSAYEWWSGQVLFEFLHMGMCGQPMAVSHAGGVLGGILAFGLVDCFSGCRCLPGVASQRKHPETADHPSMAQSILAVLARYIVRIFYRVRYRGLYHIPQHGPAVLVCNHVSYVDWLFIAGASPRPVHFVMHAAIYRKPWINWLFRLARAIPIDSGRKHPAVLHQGLRTIADTLRAGGIICLFPEGRLTRSGRVDRFRRGIEKIIQTTPVPVIPMALSGLWGSFFSHHGSGPMAGLPRRFMSRVDLIAGRHMAPNQVTAQRLRSEVLGLCGGLL